MSATAKALEAQTFRIPLVDRLNEIEIELSELFDIPMRSAEYDDSPDYEKNFWAAISKLRSPELIARRDALEHEAAQLREALRV